MESMLEGQRLERVIEIGVWIVLVAILFGVQLIPTEVISTDSAMLLASGITVFALFYYYVAWKIFAPAQRRFLKDIADIVFIGLIMLVAKEYGTLFFALLFLPVAAAAFTLDLIHSLLVATFAATLTAGEVLLVNQNVLDETDLILSGAQIAIFLLMTLFVRFLALQVRQEHAETERQRLRAARLAHDLAEERKLEAMERQFVDLASHQLFTPLSIIRGFASLLRDQPGRLSKTERGYVNEIYENSRRMVRLINDLRLEARISQRRYPIEPIVGSLTSLVHDLSREFASQLKQRQLTLTLDLPKERILARFDPDATRQIFWNLLDNALHYTPRGGRITVHAHRERSRVYLAVEDNGIGIPAADQAKIFQRFFRASNATAVYRDGTGLGLVVARELAERQHGSLAFTSQVGKGSTFILTLPAA